MAINLNVITINHLHANYFNKNEKYNYTTYNTCSNKYYKY